MYEDSALIFFSTDTRLLAITVQNACNKRVHAADVMYLFSVHKRYKLGLIFNVNLIFSHCFVRTTRSTPIEPFCFEGWNKFSVLFQFDGPGFRSDKGTTAESTEILYWGKKNISYSPDFLFRSKFRHYFHTFPGTRFSTFLHSPRKFLSGENWLMHAIFSQWDFASPRRSRNKNSSVIAWFQTVKV